MENTLFIGVLLFAAVNQGSPLTSIYDGLFQHIQDNSDGPDLPPVFDTMHAITINVQIAVNGVYEVDRIHNEVTLSTMIALSWESGVTWAPKDFNDLNSINVPRKFIWFPHIAVKNAVTAYNDLSPGRTVLRSDGVAWTMHHLNTKVSCDISEEDKCHVGVILSTHGNQLIHLNRADDDMKKSLNFTAFFDANMDKFSPFQVKETVVKETPYSNVGVPGKKERVDFQFTFRDRNRNLFSSFPTAMFSWH